MDLEVHRCRIYFIWIGQGELSGGDFKLGLEGEEERLFEEWGTTGSRHR